MHPSPDIIIVEDNVALREALADHLEDDGFVVRGVDDGASLYAALAERATQALVLDLNLPFEDGSAIAKRVRKDFPGIAILILSARVRRNDGGEAFANVADAYLSKPAMPDELTRVLRRLCQVPLA